MLGYDKPLYLMAFDHRGSFEHDLFGASELVSDEVRDGIIAVKEVIFDAHVQALAAGAPASERQVLEWVKIGAAVDGFDGFAVGRTLWEEALKDFLAGKVSRQQAVDRIATRYRDVIDAYRGAEASR